MPRHLAALLALFLTSTALAQTDRQLVERFDRADASAQHERALDAALEITKRYPTSANWAFNAARMHAQLAQPDRAIAQLRRCAELGYTGVASFEQHAHLDPLRDRDDFNQILEQVRANAAERLAKFQAEARNHTPPSFIPPTTAPDTKPALVIALHGTGGNGQQMLDALKDTCEQLGIICIAPDALRPANSQTQSGYSWTYRDESEWFVEHLITQAITEHNADPDRVYIVGFSQGANIALILTQTRQDLITAAVPICGHYEPHNTTTDTTPAPTYLLTGSRDDWKQTYLKARDDLKAADTPHELRIVTGMGHQMASKRELTRALQWCLKQSPAD